MKSNKIKNKQRYRHIRKIKMINGIAGKAIKLDGKEESNLNSKIIK